MDADLKDDYNQVMSDMDSMKFIVRQERERAEAAEAKLRELGELADRYEKHYVSVPILAIRKILQG